MLLTDENSTSTSDTAEVILARKLANNEDGKMPSDDAGSLTSVFESDNDLNTPQCMAVNENTPPSFHSACVDTGDQLSAIGKPQAQAKMGRE